MRVTRVVHTCTLPHMHSHSIVARLWLATGVRVACMGEDSVVAARHCFSAIPDIHEIDPWCMIPADLGNTTLHGEALDPKFGDGKCEMDILGRGFWGSGCGKYQGT